MRLRRGVSDSSGFTLVELLIVVVLETIIMGALGSAFVLLLNNGTTVKESLARTNDARFAASYIVSDAANSSGPETSLADTTSCPDANPPVAGTASAVVRFNWDATSSLGVTTPNIVDYVLVANTLLRRDREGGVLVGDDALATNIASATVACAPTANCTGTPLSITATIIETAGSSKGTPFQYSLTGAFRQALAVGAPVTPTNPTSLVALGGSSCTPGATALYLTGSATMRVYGNTYINSTNGTSCNAMSIGNGAAYQAGGTSILSGGTCVGVSGGVCPTSTSYSPALADPYAGIAAPTTSGRTSRSGCAGGTAQPGVYASALSITSGPCVLATGIYVLQNGLNVSNGASLANATGGVLIYITGGSFSVGGGAAVSLTSTTTGTYSAIAVWQAAADTSTISFSNAGVLTFTGALYAPKAQLNISGGASNSSATAVVVLTIVMSNSGAMVVGAPSNPPLAIAGGSAPATWTVNQPYPSTTITATGGDGNYIWTATNLPTGIVLDPSSGIASGTPTVTGTFAATLTLNDLLGDDPDTAQYTITITAAPTISTTSPLPAGEKTLAYNTTVAGSGGTTPYAWTASSLPAGSAINPSSGAITGTPTTVASSTASVTLTDAAGAAVTKSLSITITAAPAISTVSLTNGGATAGKIEKGDVVSIAFSAQMRVSSFCSTWSGNTTNQTLNASNDVTVSVSNGSGATNDALTVTSATCTFNVGSINLGSTAYDSAAATFGGTTTNVSTIAWNATTHTLTITLGTLKAGTVATVTSSTPIYTASSSLVDSAGAGLSNSPFTLAPAKQF